jgi:hypothetical protein
LRALKNKNKPTEADMEIIHDYLEHLVGKTCYDRSRALTINCRCLADVNIDNTEAKAVVRFMLRFIEMKPSAQKSGMAFLVRRPIGGGVLRLPVF